MLFSFALWSVLAPAAIQAVASERPEHCGAGSPSQEFLSLSRAFRSQEANATAGGFSAAAAAQSTQINTYIHIMASDRTARGGYVSQSTIDEQMRILNSNYANTGFSFVLRDVDYTVDPNKSYLRSLDDEYYIKRDLRKGSYSDLNLYYFVNTFRGNTGWCYYPTNAPQGSESFIRDGCVIHQGSLPGGSYAPWNEGKITSHEVGHWMGLMHTFENGCYGNGDEVDDTPFQSTPTSGCPIGRDSCTQPGVDPIHNFMDYSDNACQTEFTNGQAARMRSWWDYYRG
ncbi:hypothetical protein QQS21_003699 [Conoideocrella luteorostrata]|uniref:Peptidase M43 pregnancy-associated plasma-A domain-containing protein n=1 Tax=Conoideocrella luteorostrata TaxID=1105319 RepID=A0AAJ0CV82_9HYPO|nr:hypothetical protein QQS21_003699 [Conoideocrella luteorostrata]